MFQKLNSERGHVGPTMSAIFGIAAAIIASIGIGFDSKVTEIIGIALFGLAIVGATMVPHLWIQKVWRRLDRITDETDPDRHTEPGVRIEL